MKAINNPKNRRLGLNGQKGKLVAKHHGMCYFEFEKQGGKVKLLASEAAVESNFILEEIDQELIDLTDDTVKFDKKAFGKY